MSKIVEVIVHAAEPDRLPRRKGIQIAMVNMGSRKRPGEVAIYGTHVDVVKYVADVFGLSDPEWFADNVVLGATPMKSR